MTTPQLSLKLLIDTKSYKVLFAEAGKDVVDFLFSLLSMPVGSIIKLLTKEKMAGCIANLYQSVENLDDTYILSKQNKTLLLNPTTAASSPSLLHIGVWDWEVGVAEIHIDIVQDTKDQIRGELLLIFEQ